MRILPVLFLFNFFSGLAMDFEDSKWDADLYDQYSKQQYLASLTNLEKFDFYLEKFKTILELGCNTANVSGTLADQYPDKLFIGIDPEQTAINLGRKKYETKKNLNLICDSAQKYCLRKYGLPRANFVSCYHVLHWIPREDLQSVFDNITANLDEEGILDISTSAKQEMTPLTKAVLRTIIKLKWWLFLPYCIKQVVKGQDMLTLLTASELTQFADQAGLVIDYCQENNELVSFQTKEEFSLWLTSILKPYGIESIFRERQEEFINEVVNLYCTEFNPAANGSIEYHFKGLHMTAHKAVHE